MSHLDRIMREVDIETIRDAIALIQNPHTAMRGEVYIDRDIVVKTLNAALESPPEGME